MCSPSVGCGTTGRMQPRMQSGTRCTAAASHDAVIRVYDDAGNDRDARATGRVQKVVLNTLDESTIYWYNYVPLATIIGKGNGTRERSSKAKRARENGGKPPWLDAL